MCGACGEILGEEVLAALAINGVKTTTKRGQSIVVSRAEAESLESVTVSRLLSARKLSLVLDLDHTLLHCVTDSRAESLVAAGEAGDPTVSLLPRAVF